VATTIIPQPTVTTTPSPSPLPVTASAGDVEAFFSKYSDEYHVDRELLKKIARCESSFNASAENGPYAGMFQFAGQTWTSVRTVLGMDANQDLRKNAEESIRTAAYMIGHGQANAWSACL
jgi:soluble lytic murein transglycosylase-like protein